MFPGDPRGKLLSALERFFAETLTLGGDQTLLAAYSGGADSSALVWGLSQLAARGRFQLEAAHVDHALDPGSRSRAELAGRVCRRLGVPLSLARRPVAAELIRAHGREGAARAVRYQALEEIRARRGASYVVTAHQRDDQIETVCMRLLHGSGWEGLAGIPECKGSLLRPLLGLTRVELRAAVGAAGLEIASDPENRDLGLQRNRVRDQLRPYLEGLHPELGGVCVGVARASAGARQRVEELFTRTLDPATDSAGASLELAALRRLPPALLSAAAAMLHRLAGAPYPPSSAAVSELARQMARGKRVGSDCGDGWRWRSRGSRLRLVRAPESLADFTYTLDVPGTVEVAELSLRVRVTRGPVEAWMFEGSPRRAGLGPAVGAGAPVVVRNRRPGDRLQPLGCDYSRRLKEVLIDRRVPRAERDRIPLLCVGDRIAWVPGVTIDEAFRIRDGESAWIAEVQPA